MHSCSENIASPTKIVIGRTKSLALADRRSGRREIPIVSASDSAEFDPVKYTYAASKVNKIRKVRA